MWVESHLELCQITNNQINHNLIKIIQLSLTIFDLWSHSHLWVVGWMDILTFYLNHLSPLQGYFYNPVVDLNKELIAEYYKREMSNLR